MSASIRSPFMLFRFAVSERDWALAGLLAARLARSPYTRRLLERELSDAAPEAGRPSLVALRALGRVLRAAKADARRN